MLSLILPKNFLGVSVGVLLLSLALVIVSVGLLLWLLRWPPEKKGTIKYDLLKDLALAFLTAVLVTAFYSSVLEFRRVAELFSLVVGKDVREEVLGVATEEVFKREIMRENAELRFTVQRDGRLPDSQALIEVQIDYDMFSLKPSGDDKFFFTQELEHFNAWNPETNLPRFDKIVVGDAPPYQGERLLGLVKQGSFTADTPATLQYWPEKLEDRPKKALHVTTIRTEVINIPGSYHIVMGELTKGVEVSVKAPDDIEHKLKHWFARKGPDFKERGVYHKLDGIILPGQGLTFQFSKKADAKPAAPPAAPPSKSTPPGKAGHGTS